MLPSQRVTMATRQAGARGGPMMGGVLAIILVLMVGCGTDKSKGNTVHRLGRVTHIVPIDRAGQFCQAGTHARYHKMDLICVHHHLARHQH
jgi:hypothetical protein